ENARQIVDHLLDFLRVDVVAARDHEILGAPDDADIAARIDRAEIAGDEKSVRAELFGRLLGHLPVALEDVRTAHLDHADLARRHDAAAFRLGNAELDAG